MKNRNFSGKINIAFLILVFIIFYVLFKIDIKESIQSERFQKNIKYFKESVFKIKDSFFAQEKIDGFLNNVLENDFNQNTLIDSKNSNIIQNIYSKSLEQDLSIPITNPELNNNTNYNFQLRNTMNTMDKDEGQSDNPNSF